MTQYSTKRKRAQPVYINKIKVGEIIGQTLRKHARASIHMLHNPKGWSCNIELLEQARNAGVKNVLIYDDESGKKLPRQII